MNAKRQTIWLSCPFRQPRHNNLLIEIIKQLKPLSHFRQIVSKSQKLDLDSNAWHVKKNLMLKICLNVIASCLITIILLESSLWLFHPLPFSPLACRYPYRNNIKGLKPLVIYERNMFGLRSVSLSQATSLFKRPNTIRILCIGASTTDQLTQNTEDLWSSILELKLQKELANNGYRIEVAAYGRGGDTVLDTYAWLKNNLVSFSPDIVITLFGINDLCWGGRNPLKNTGEQQVNAKEDRWKRALRSFSQIYRHVSKIREGFSIKSAIKSGKAIPWGTGYLPIVWDAYKKYPFVENVSRRPDPIDNFEKIFSDLLDYLKKQHIQTIVLAQPVLWQKKMKQEELEVLWFPVATESGYVRASTEWLEMEMNKYNQVQKKCAESKEFIYIPLDMCIPKTTEMFFDDCHFTDQGNVLVADAIYPVLLSEVKKMKAGKLRLAE